MPIVKKYGWQQSKMDGSEHKFNEVKSFNIPEQYSYVSFLPPVENQGATNMCVTYALAAHLDWNCNVDKQQDTSMKNNISKQEIYNARSIPGDNGMTFKEALSFLRKRGVTSDHGIMKIDSYALVGSVLALKQALIMNGPCVAGLMVRDESAYEFWNGRKRLGGHAVAIVGYTRDGFIIRNSWGEKYGDHGYAILKYYDFGQILECWTIVD